MRAYNIYNSFLGALLLSFVAVSLVMGCERRPLEEEVGSIVRVPFKIDWSQSGLDVSTIHRATIRVFPHDGKPAYDVILQESLTDVEMILPIGKYSFVIFNETTEPEQGRESLVFNELDDYNKFMVTTSEDAFRGLYTKADDATIRKTPAALASWSIDEFEVTKEMIVYTRTKSVNTRTQFIPSVAQAIEKELEKVATIVPLSTVKTLNLIIRVENLSSAKKASGAISGATQGIMLSTRKPTTGGVTHIFIVNGRKYDDPDKPKHGTVGATLFVFNVEDVDDLKCELTLDFELKDGTFHNPVIYDITKDLKQDKIDITINVGFQTPGEPGDPDSPDNPPIVLPDIDGGGDVMLEDWGPEVIVPIE